MPSGPELFRQVFVQVVMPAVGETVRNLLGVFGRPLVWFYRRTIGSAVNGLIAKADSPGAGEDSIADRESESSDDYQSRIQTFTSHADSVVGTLGFGLRLAALGPCWLLFLLFTSVAMAPIVITHLVLGN